MNLLDIHNVEAVCSQSSEVFDLMSLTEMSGQSVARSDVDSSLDMFGGSEVDISLDMFGGCKTNECIGVI